MFFCFCFLYHVVSAPNVLHFYYLYLMYYVYVYVYVYGLMFTHWFCKFLVILNCICALNQTEQSMTSPMAHRAETAMFLLFVFSATTSSLAPTHPIGHHSARTMSPPYWSRIEWKRSILVLFRVYTINESFLFLLPSKGVYHGIVNQEQSLNHMLSNRQTAVMTHDRK